MLSLDQVIDYEKLWSAEIDQLARHDYGEAILAAEMGKYATESSDGRKMLKQVILDDMSAALAEDDFQQASKLLAIMRAFIEHHPDNPRAASPLDRPPD